MALGTAAREHQEDLLAALSAPEREQLGELLRRIAGQQGLTPGVHPGFKGSGRGGDRDPWPARRVLS
jgi:hypothetical protein